MEHPAPRIVVGKKRRCFQEAFDSGSSTSCALTLTTILMMKFAKIILSRDGSVYECGDGMRRSFLFKGGDEEECEYEYETCEEKIGVEEEGIDMRAEEFIARFRQQLRLQ
ncbi:hypothetical protein OIU77_024605 [Salix suchowensis]|uniref:Uncharacterized protein n=1 Tax=Salix suchowensis TaxID=1278906 RepID=A0ABQ9BV13_9ROSI|nr:hypothetical protein OIU77_024605 [Salix suchowensis]